MKDREAKRAVKVQARRTARGAAYYGIVRDARSRKKLWESVDPYGDERVAVQRAIDHALMSGWRVV